MNRELKEKLDDLLVKISMAPVHTKDKDRLKFYDECRDKVHMLLGEAGYQTWYIQEDELE